MIPGAIFAAYLLNARKVLAYAMFIFIFLLFILSKYYLVFEFESIKLTGIEEVLYFPNLVFASFLVFLGTTLYRNFQEDQRLELNRSNQVKQLLINVLSHYLRTPIVSLQQLLDFADDNDLPREQYNEYLQKVRESLHHTSNLIDNTLFWARNQNKGLTIEKTKVDLKALVEEAMRLVEPIAIKKNISLESDLENDCVCEIDRQLILLSTLNLLNNAIKFTPRDKGVVKISLNRDQNGFLLQVEDNGVGMSEQQIQKLFDLNKTINYGTDGERGAGLGLVLSEDFIELNGGSLEVKSLEDKGSLLSMSLSGTA